MVKAMHSSEEMQSICESHARSIKTPLDNVKVLRTIAKLESDFGRDCRPRFEPAYHPGGLYFQKSTLLQRGFDSWGAMVSMSYGPFQIMWAVACEFNFSIYSEPEELHDGKVSGFYVSKYISQSYSEGAKTIDLILAAYNGGMGAIKRQNDDVKKYVAKGLQIFNSL